MKRNPIVLLLSSFALLASCTPYNPSRSSESVVTSSGSKTEPTSVDSSASYDSSIGSAEPASSEAKQNSSQTPEEGEVEILLADGASSCSSSNVEVDNDNNRVTIHSVGEYFVTGSLSNGTLLIDADEVDEDNDEVTLRMNGVSITKSGTLQAYGPIAATGSAKLEINRVKGSTTIITDNRSSMDESSECGAAIFSNKKLKFKGSGAINVISTFNNGVQSDTHVRCEKGTLQVSAPNNAVKAHKSVILGQAGEEGNFVITSTASGGAGIRVDKFDSEATAVYGDAEEDDDIAGIELKTGTYSITAVGKAVSAGDGDEGENGYVYIEGGTGKITSSADKGIKAESDIYLDGGSYEIQSKNDGVHSSSAGVYVNNGYYDILANAQQFKDGTDTVSPQGIKGSTYFEMNGGTVIVERSYEGISAAKMVFNGGTSISNANDDGWNANSTYGGLYVNGGSHYVYANGDGVDSNGNIVQTGGILIVSAPNSGGNGPLDYGDGNYSMTQSGGICVAYGTSGMAVGASSGNQGSVLLSSHTSVSSGRYLLFGTSSGGYAVKTTRAASTTYASFPEWVSGATYSIGYLSSPELGEVVFEEGGLYKLTASPSNTSLASGTFSSSSLHVGNSGGGGPGGGGGGGGRPGW